MGLLQKIQAKTEEARAKEKIRPLLESRMMRDILLEIGQRGNEALDPQSVPLAPPLILHDKARQAGCCPAHCDKVSRKSEPTGNATRHGSPGTRP